MEWATPLLGATPPQGKELEMTLMVKMMMETRTEPMKLPLKSQMELMQRELRQGGSKMLKSMR